MTSNAAPEPWHDGGAADELRELPVDPDLDAAEDTRHRPGTPSPFPPPKRSRWPRVDWTLVAAVVAGGFVGGIIRYAVGQAWPTPAGRFPWAIWTVNTAGAFLLALTLVLVMEVLPPTKYVRAAVGTGLCGALTTFSSVATGVDQLIGHGRGGLAAGYLAASVAAGLAAASCGVVLGRSVAAYREKGRE